MAIICCICGKKQSGWISDYPLSPKLNQYRVCAECGEEYQKIQSAEKLEDVSDEIASLKERMQKGAVDETVTDYLSLLFNGDNAEKTMEDINTAIVEQRNEAINSIMVTSGYDFENYRIIRYCDYISAEAVFGMGMFKALLASVSSVAGAESEPFKVKIKEAKSKAIYDIKVMALELGANAIIGIDIDFTMIGGDMVVIIASGTAVVIEEKKAG
ncbi:MAG: YbjQ family protein [Acetatifactor sp.]|nr:YbjQ family protein [Acetatifactor sp.]